MADDAAILLMLLEEQEAASVVSRLDPQAIERIGGAMYGLKDVDEGRVSLALERFLVGARKRTGVDEDVTHHVEKVVRAALPAPRAVEMLERIVPESAAEVLPSLKWLADADLAMVAATEHPQVVALMLIHLPADRGAALIAQFPAEEQADLLYRAATLGPVSPPALAAADALFAEMVGIARSDAKTQPARSGTVAAILNQSSKPNDVKVLKVLAKRDKALAARIEDEMLIFEDLLALDDKDLGTLFRLIDAADLALALRTVEEPARERVLGTMSARAADGLRDTMAEQARVSLTDVQAAQRRVVLEARRLADAGEIVLGTGGGDYV